MAKKSVLSGLTYFILFGMAVCSKPTPEEMIKLCESYNFEEPIFTYPNDPQHYIICAENVAYTGDCGTGKCFDASVRKCGVTCPTVPTDICTNKLIGDRVELKDDCQKYYICMGAGSAPIAVTCPTHQHYSKLAMKCTSPSDAYCLPPPQWCNNQPDGTRFAATKCFEYYECASKTIALKTCPYNQYFDKEKNECVLGMCVDPNDGSTSKREPNCADYAEGVKMAHEKCYKYYVCLNNNAYIGQCSTGYYFHELLKTCVEDVKDVCVYN